MARPLRLRLPTRGGANTEVEGFRLLQEIGAGGFSIVHLAEEIGARRRVAVKVARLKDAQTRGRFEAEGRIGERLAAVRGVVGVLAQTRSRDGRPVLVMPYYDLGSADALLRDGARPGLAEVAEMIGQAAQGLEAMHAQQLLHRDVSPRNLLRSTELGAALGDLGCARVINSTEQPPWTEAFTPGFAAPEARRDTAQTIASDVYGLAATTWALLTGAPPYGPPPDRDSEALARYELRRITAAPPPEGLLGLGVPEATARVLSRALDPDPSRRPARVRDISEALQLPPTAVPASGPSLVSAEPGGPSAAVGPLQPPAVAPLPVESTELSAATGTVGRRGRTGARAPGRRAMWAFAVVLCCLCFLVAYGVVKVMGGAADAPPPSAGQVPSAAASGPPASAPPPAAAAPQDLQIATDRGDELVLRWTPVRVPNALSVLYRATAGGSWEQVDADTAGGRAVVAVDRPAARQCFRLVVVVGAGAGVSSNQACTSPAARG
jgi:hypothetical protein